MQLRTRTWLAFLVLAALVAASAALSWRHQRPISFHDGQGWDGVDYVAMARQLSSGGRPQAEAPFVYRLGAPWLAGRLDAADPLDGFRRLNGALSLLLPLGLFAWLRRVGLSAGWALGMAALFALQWHAPLRLTPYYPAHVDPLMWLCWLLALGLLEAGRRWPELPRALAWSAFALVAVPVREVLLLPLVLQALQGAPRPWGPGWALSWKAWLLAGLPRARLLAPLAGMAVFLAIRLWALPTTHYSFINTALWWLWLKSAPHMLHALLLAYGPLPWVLLALGWRPAGAALARRPEWVAGLAALFVLGWTGGSDSERLLYWAAPLVLALAGLAGAELAGRLPRRPAALAWAGALLAAQALAQRLCWTIPDHPGSERLVLPLLTPLSSTGRYLDLYSQHARPEVAVLGLAGNLLVLGGLWLWGRRLLARSRG